MSELLANGNMSVYHSQMMSEEDIYEDEAFDPSTISDDRLIEVERNSNGDSYYQLIDEDGGSDTSPDESTPDFYENLVDKIAPDELSRITLGLLDDIENDKQSRSSWELMLSDGLKYLGWKFEEFDPELFKAGSGAFDSTMSGLLFQFWAIARAELFPEGGPVNSEIAGDETDAKEERAQIMRQFLNFYLTKMDKIYYPDSDRLLLNIIFYGVAFRRTYQDPLTGHPISRFISPIDLIADNTAASLLESPRITVSAKYSKKEVLLRERKGIFKENIRYSENEISDNYNDDDDKSIVETTIEEIEGISPDSSDPDAMSTYYECSADLVINGIDEECTEDVLPLPYRITICKGTKKAVSIVRNWKEGDSDYKRKPEFTRYEYLPSFGLYGVGLVHLAGANAITLTHMLRDIINAAKLRTFPGGLKTKGLKTANNNKVPGPCEFIDVETDGINKIQDNIMLLPYQEPSAALIDQLEKLAQKMAQSVGMGETAISENRPDAPVGTTLALLDINTKVQSSILRSMHVSLSHELENLYNLFKENWVEEVYPFTMGGKSFRLLREDFNEDISITPVSDPNLPTAAHRLMRAEAKLSTALKAPQLHDMREVFKGVYLSMGIPREDVDKILPLPKKAIPLDPITENMNLMTGKPVVTAMWQDHKSHIPSHSASPGGQTPEGQAHIRDHMACQYLIDMQMQLGIQLPPLEQLAQPEVQNQIAMMVAQLVQQQQQSQQEAQQQQQPPNPNEVMMADIRQRQEEAALRHADSQLKAETEAFKAQLRYEADTKKIMSQQEMAEDKNDVELEIANMKHADANAKAESKIPFSSGENV